VKKHVIASQIGAVPETLSRALKKFEQDGLVQRQGKTLKILRADDLYAVAFPAAEDR